MNYSPSPLPIARVRLTARAEAPLQLPVYTGSMLRGAFGHALLALSSLPHMQDQPCALQAVCPYCQIFATPPLPAHSLQKFSQMPHAYVIEPPFEGARSLQAGDTFRFSLVLIGKALGFLPTIVVAWERALRTGLNKQRVPCQLLTVTHENGNVLWTMQDRRIMPIANTTPLPPAQTLKQQATLHLASPLRLQKNGKPARSHTLDARTLLITLARRWQLLLDIHLGSSAPQQDFSTLAALATTIQLEAENLRWFDWGRFSQRQQKEMKFGGLMGTLSLHGNLQPFSELLHIGQWLHVGKNTSFGLGGYRIEKKESIS
ncbi:CRISPR system precrRNA processing endoribonuclease RAMP protein Cas6 [Kerstersia gyiorum]|uniref:CRISPR system precrRNA processing endoribonuclease RAMP protein Cas6 n=1 Tax=Kerstersia gyiorum TaxID=206506 RepID=UPI003B427BD3